MATPRVLVVLDTSAAWSRGILRGFAHVAHEQGWTLLHYHSNVDLEWLVTEWPPSAAVLGPSLAGPWPARLRECVSVSVNFDRSAEGVASVCLDEARIAKVALSHFLARGFRTLTTFRFNDAAFGALRERHFCEAAEHAGARLEPGWWADGASPPRSEERPDAIGAWLEGLRAPCGVFACCDAWARVVARYAGMSGLRVPEDLALVGVDNDAIECEIMAPPLSSVALPWRSVGESAARLVQLGLRGKPIAGTRVLVEPLEVVTRRSSDTFAIDDPLVAKAVAWIHQHAERRMTLAMVAGAVAATRQQLERHFRRALGRTVMQEARRAHVEIARRLLATTALPLPQVAKHSGFTNAALLSVAFRRELGVPPGAYRRRSSGLLDADDA
jgi:LacI family transcriptional regulator